MKVMEPAWERPSMTVMCAYEQDLWNRDPHLDCDGMFCHCPCHVARDKDRWARIKAWYLRENPRAAIKVPVGVL